MNTREPNEEFEVGIQCPLCKSNEARCPRCQAYERLPKWRLLQAFITFVMGTPHAGQRPLFQHSRATRVVAVFAAFYASVVLTCSLVALFATGNLFTRVVTVPAIIASVLVTSGALRTMSTFVLHYASHGAFGKYDRIVGEFASMTALTLSFDEYLRGHIYKHHPLLTSTEDPDQRTIAAWKFVPGMPRTYYTRRLWKVVLSPHYFFLHLRGRMDSQLANSLSLLRRVSVVLLHAMTLVVAITTCVVFDSLTPLFAWAIAWLLPLTYGTYLSMVLFALGLHRWFMDQQPGMNAREFYLSKTGGRFFGDAFPGRDVPFLKRYVLLGKWWFRLVVLHLLVGKLFVMGISDNQQHDIHHLDPHGTRYEWFNGIYSRQHLATHGREARSLWHTWGSVLTPIRLNFARMAAMSKAEVEMTVHAKDQNLFRNDM